MSRYPPEVKAIVKARVMTDKKAARVLARLHAAGLLPAVWVPPKEVRELRSLIAGRRRMVSLATRVRIPVKTITYSG
jgi:transposase